MTKREVKCKSSAAQIVYNGGGDHCDVGHGEGAHCEHSHHSDGEHGDHSHHSDGDHRDHSHHSDGVHGDGIGDRLKKGKNE